LVEAYPALAFPVYFVRAAGLALSLVAGFYLFPDGRFSPPLTRWLALAWFLVVAAWLAFPQLPANLIYVDTWTANLGLSFAIYGAVYLSGAAAQVYRYMNVSGLVKRQQTKWIVWGVSIGVAGFVLYHLPVVFFPQLETNSLYHLRYIFIARPINYLLILMAPVGLTISILRFRLWDVDRLINRSLVYGLLSVILALVYLVLVVFLRSFLLGFTERTSTMSTIASTLAIAVLFTPLRSRIQSWIDLKFYRRKYDTEKTMERFRSSLRHRLDIDHLSHEIIRLVEDTVQPEHASLWISASTQKSRAQKKKSAESAVRNDYRNV
jgi:hypothetical protein